MNTKKLWTGIAGAMIGTVVHMLPGLYWVFVGAFVVVLASMLVVGMVSARRLAR